MDEAPAEARGSGGEQPPGRTRRRALAILAGVAAAVVAVAVLVAAIVGGGAGSGAERAARGFVGALLAGDCDRVLASLSADTNRRFDDLSRQFSTAADPDGVDLRRRACPGIRRNRVERATVASAESLLEQGERALVRVRTSIPPGRRSVLGEVDVYTVREGEAWKVDLTLNVVASNFLLSQVLDQGDAQ